MISKIVKEVFKKAEEEYASKAKTTLSKYVVNVIEEKFNIIISERTLSRSYDKYILSKEDMGSLTAENVNALCRYLGFKDYSEYKKKNTPISKVRKSVSGFVAPNSSSKIIVITSVLLIVIFLKGYEIAIANKTTKTECMVWEQTKYVKISCDKERHSIYGTRVIPMDKKEFETMKKVDLKRSTIIFYPDGKPKYWYCKVNSKEAEFFTSHGFHPVNGKKLNTVTKYIFNKYVPVHLEDANSFIESSKE